jgi:hypothetical protein
MAKTKGLEVDRRVGIALSVLPQSQKTAVERVIRSPRSFTKFAALPGRVQQMATSGQPLYKMRISPSLRLIYTMVGDTFYVVDLVERATLNHFVAKRADKKVAKAQVKKPAPKDPARKTPDVVEK